MTTATVAQTVALYDTLHAAIAQNASLNVLYATDGKVTKERVLHPLEIVIGKCGSDKIWAWDSLREDVLTFRLDRIIAYRLIENEGTRA